MPHVTIGADRPLITADGFIDRGALVFLADRLIAAARDRGASLSTEEAWRQAWAEAARLYRAQYQRPVPQGETVTA